MFEKNTYSTKEMKVETTKSAPSKELIGTVNHREAETVLGAGEGSNF